MSCSKYWIEQLACRLHSPCTIADTLHIWCTSLDKLHTPFRMAYESQCTASVSVTHNALVLLCRKLPLTAWQHPTARLQRLFRKPQTFTPHLVIPAACFQAPSPHNLLPNQIRASSPSSALHLDQQTQTVRAGQAQAALGLVSVIELVLAGWIRSLGLRRQRETTALHHNRTCNQLKSNHLRHTHSPSLICIPLSRLLKLSLVSRMESITQLLS